MCGLTIHHQTLHPCRQLWAVVEEELIGLYIMVNVHVKQFVSGSGYLPTGTGGGEAGGSPGTVGTGLDSRGGGGGAERSATIRN